MCAFDLAPGIKISVLRGRNGVESLSRLLERTNASIHMKKHKQLPSKWILREHAQCQVLTQDSARRLGLSLIPWSIQEQERERRRRAALQRVSGPSEKFIQNQARPRTHSRTMKLQRATQTTVMVSWDVGDDERQVLFFPK